MTRLRSLLVIALLAKSSSAIANEQTGLHSGAFVAGPNLGSHSTTEFSIISSHFSSPPEVHIQARTAAGSIDTSECPANYGNLGTPIGVSGHAVTDLSTPVVTSGGWAFVVGYVDSAWQLFSNHHTGTSTCAGWSSWSQWPLPTGVASWATAPGAVTLPDGRTVVFVVAGSTPYLYYRIIKWNAILGLYQYSSWYYYVYGTYPSGSAGAIGAPTATIVGGQINVSAWHQIWDTVWQRTTSVGSGLNDLTWYDTDDCHGGTGNGYGWRYDRQSTSGSLNGVTSASNGSVLWFGVVTTTGELKVHNPDWSAGCSDSYPIWTTIPNGWTASTYRPSLGFTSNWGSSSNYMLVQLNYQWFGGVLVGGMFESDFNSSNSTWPTVSNWLNAYY